MEVVDTGDDLLNKGRYDELWYQRNLVLLLLGVQGEHAHQRLQTAEVHVFEQETHTALLEESAVALQQILTLHLLE